MCEKERTLMYGIKIIICADTIQMQWIHTYFGAKYLIVYMVIMFYSTVQVEKKLTLLKLEIVLSFSFFLGNLVTVIVMLIGNSFSKVN